MRLSTLATHLGFLALLGLASCGDDAPSPEGCEQAACHGVAGATGAIEQAHPKARLSCSDCHGGDRKAKDKETAHVAPAPQWVADRGGYIKNLSVNELDDVAPDYVRFINPGDYRAAAQSCGAQSPRANGSGCHQRMVEAAPRSVMATFVGHFNVPRFQAGMQGRAAELGSRDIADLDFPASPPPGTVPSLRQASVPPDDAPRDSADTLMDHYLSKNCTHCHQWSYGRNDARGNFRSSGCSSCHVLYDNDGVSSSSDPSAVRERPPHAVKHEITTAIPESQCERCHYQGARIGLLYRGVVEWGFTADPPFPNIGESLHNHPPEFYLQASSDPAHPADLHFKAGMACADCHVGRDVHGSGRIYSTSKFQVAIRCENCHGTVDTVIAEGTAVVPLKRGGTVAECEVTPDDSGKFRNCAGDPLKNMYRRDDGTVWLRPVKAGRELRVSQVKDLIDSNFSPNMTAAMGRDATTGFSHTEVIECDGCHTAYRQYCFGCHVTMDYGQKKKDLLSGETTFGAEVTGRQDYSLDMYIMGTNRHGKIRSFCPSMQVFLTAIERDADGNEQTLFANRIRRNAQGGTGFNWATDVPHVTSSVPQNCSRCHADAGKGCDDLKARESYGFGSGRYEFTDEDGITHDLTRLLDDAGLPTVEFSHEGQGAVPPAMRDRALGICVEDQPR